MRTYLQLVSSPVARKRYTSPTKETVWPCWGVRIIGFIRLVSSLFGGQCLHELRRPLDPARIGVHHHRNYIISKRSGGHLANAFRSTLLAWASAARTAGVSASA